MAAKLYSRFPQNAIGGNTSGEGPMDMLSDTIKLMLRVGHTPDQTGDEVKADLPADELSATGYTAGGATLGSKTFATTSLVTAFDNTADIVWTITGSATFDTGVLFDDTPTSPADPLIMYDALGTQTVTDGDFTYTPNAAGFYTITVA